MSWNVNSGEHDPRHAAKFVDDCFKFSSNRGVCAERRFIRNTYSDLFGVKPTSIPPSLQKARCYYELLRKHCNRDYLTEAVKSNIIAALSGMRYEKFDRQYAFRLKLLDNVDDQTILGGEEQMATKKKTTTTKRTAVPGVAKEQSKRFTIDGVSLRQLTFQMAAKGKTADEIYKFFKSKGADEKKEPAATLATIKSRVTWKKGLAPYMTAAQLAAFDKKRSAPVVTPKVKAKVKAKVAVPVVNKPKLPIVKKK